MLKQSAIHVLGGRSFTALFAPIRKDIVPIFMLHRMHAPDYGVVGHSTDFLDRALNYLSNNNYNFLSLAQLVQCLDGDLALPKNAVVFTCDDGFWDHAEIVAPTLAKYDCPLTIFLITGFIDGELWPWDYRVKHILGETRKSTIDVVVANNSLHFKLDSEQARERATRVLRDRLKDCEHTEFLRALHELEERAGVEISSRPPKAHRPMTWDQARALEKTNVRFAPHAVTHTILSKMTDETAEYEITHSWRRLQEELERPLPVFCYPTGRTSDFGSREINLINKAGLELAVATTPGYVDIKNDHVADKRYQLNRFGFPDTMKDLIQYASWIERLKEIVRCQ